MSNISIPGCISDLLFERENIVLPGIGLFETRLKESSVDQVQGMIHPPSKEIIFNSNVTGDDGVLTDYIRQKYQLEDSTARIAVAEFTNDLRLKMHKKEIITIPDVGRLYLDFEKKMQFLPDRVNYNKDSFGLPALNFYPVMKETPGTTATPKVAATTLPPKQEEVVSSPNSDSPLPAASSVVKPPETASVQKQEAVETIIPPSPKHTTTNQNGNSSITDILNKVLPILLIVSIAVIAYVFYSYWKDSAVQPPLFEKDKTAKPEGRINQKPSLTDDTNALYEDEDIIEKTNEGMTYDDESISDSESNEMSVEETSDEIPEDQISSPENGKLGIIIVGGFSSARNASRLVKKIQQKGYNPYSDASGAITRVGVEFRFNSVAELDDMHRQIQREFNESAWILEPR